MSSDQDSIKELIKLHDEASIRRYEVRWSFYKVVFGTALVGIVAAALPFVIQYLNVRAEQRDSHRAHIDRYFQTAINQDIELRIRSAEYFRYLSDNSDESRNLWSDYYGSLVDHRTTIRGRILELQRIVSTLESERDNADTWSFEQHLDLQSRREELVWARAEIGYAPIQGEPFVQDTTAAGQPIAMALPRHSVQDSAELAIRLAEFIRENANLQYFRPEEFLLLGASNSDEQSRCYGLNQLPPEELWPNIVQVIRALEDARELLGEPLVIVAAYRSPQYNACVGGASSSQHVRFAAIDARPITGSVEALYEILLTMQSEGDFVGGLGLYNSYVHVDGRSANALWSSANVSNRSRVGEEVE